MKLGKVWLAALLLIGGVALTAPASAQVYPTCPPGYFFSPSYGLCFPARYLNDPGYFEDQGYYPFAPGFGFAPLFFHGDRFGRFHHFGHGFVGHGGGHFGGHGRR